MFLKERFTENEGIPESKKMMLRGVRGDFNVNKRIEKDLITQNNNTELKDEKWN